ncbi:MAG TPA: hypothetical protein VM694_07740 [Polyangium sp.]|nr:hypothetical protein [Polyangium sp.]
MRSWRSGRTILLGDAAWCMTLYSGMGASLGLAGGSLLGELLLRHPHEIETALRTWEDRLMPFARQHQRSALIKAQFFTPSSPIIDILCKGLMRRAQGKKRPEGARTALEQFLSGPVNVEFAA